LAPKAELAAALREVPLRGSESCIFDAGRQAVTGSLSPKAELAAALGLRWRAL